MSRPDGRVMDDLTFFAFHHMMSQDIDPVYDLLRQLEAGLDPEEALWYSLLYVAFYKVGSAEHVRQEGWVGVGPIWPPFASLPCGTERRGHRSPKAFLAHVDSLLRLQETHGGIEGWLRRHWTREDPRTDWNLTRQALEEAHGNGRWASFKMAEILMRVHGWPIEPPDTGMEGSTGPKAGIQLIYGDAEDRPRVLEERAEWLCHVLSTRLPGAFAPDIAQVETILCDFHSLCEGRYYVGNDIDQILWDLDDDRIGERARRSILEARRLALPDGYLAELRGRTEMEARRARRAYRDNGLILYRDPETGEPYTQTARWRPPGAPIINLSLPFEEARP